MRNRNNEFILIIYIARIKMANFECRELEIGLEFGHISFDKRKNFSEDSSEPKKYSQVIRVRGAAAPRVFNLNYLLSSEALHSAVHLRCVSLMAFCTSLLVFLKPSLSGCLLASTEKG